MRDALTLQPRSRRVGGGRRSPATSCGSAFHEPNEAELREIQAQFELHPLAIEDALHAHQRPKLELYGDSLFLVLRTAQLQGDHVAFGETHIFAGQGFVISIRHGPSASYAPGAYPL